MHSASFAQAALPDGVRVGLFTRFYLVFVRSKCEPPHSSLLALMRLPIDALVLLVLCSHGLHPFEV